MNPADVAALNDLVSRGGLQFVLVALVVVLGLLLRWFFNQLIQSKNESIAALRQERDEWRTTALALMRTGERAVNVAEQQVGLR